MNVDPAKFNCISLFSGAGGLDMGVELALGAGSCRVVAYVEREAYACEVLTSRMDKGDVDPAPVWTDVTTFDARQFRGLVDIVSGGFPCQDISLAGKQAGIEGEKSGLWSEFARIVEEAQPRLVFIENVAALRTKGLEVVLSDLATLGYDAEWGTLRASDVGSTHHRNRIFILAHANGPHTHKELGFPAEYTRLTPGLGSEAIRWPSLRDQKMPDGRAWSKSDRTLNPRFVEWLMGWPIGWTDCDSQVTEWFLFKPLTRSVNSREGSSEAA